MKKILAIILSLVLVFTLVTVVACNKDEEKFYEVDLTDKDTREDFVNALAEKVDIEKLIGDPTQEGWAFGLEENVKSKLDLELGVTPDGATSAYSGKGTVELSESAKASLKMTSGMPALAGSVSLAAKGNVELTDNLYDIIGQFSEEVGGLIGDEEFDLAATVKSLITNFDYGVDAYVDNEVALIKISDGLYGKLPKAVTDMLGSKLIKITFGNLMGGDVAMLAAEKGEVGGLPTLDTEDVKEAIDEVIDEVILPFKISVAVSTKNGYAIRLTVSSESVLTILDTAFADLENKELVTSIKNAISSDTKFELTARVDANGAFASVGTEYKLGFAVDGLSFDNIGTIKVSASLSGSFELKKFNGTVSKPSNASEYKELDF